jgi:hypothetical protein
MLGAPAHYAAGGIEAEGAASGKQQRVDALNQMRGVERLEFAFAGGATEDEPSGHRSLHGQQDGASRARLIVLRVSDAETGERSESRRHEGDDTTFA